MFENVLLDLGARMNADLIASTVEFCLRADARLTVLNVFEEPPEAVSDYFSALDLDLRTVLLEHHQAEIDRLLPEEAKAQDRTTVELRWGKDFMEAIKLVRDGGFDLLITGSTAPGGAPDSMAMHLMRKCPCPVWIHRGNLWKGAVRILAAVNTSDVSADNRALNEKILAHAARLNEILRGHLHVITCWSGYMESVLTSPRFNKKEKTEYLEHEQSHTERELESLFAAAGLTDEAKAKIIHGNPAKVIPAYAADQKMDVVVMGSVARTGVPGLVVGNTVERIVSTVANSVLAIKPDKFVSPVR